MCILHEKNESMQIIVVMGVSGSGKSTIAKMLAEALSILYFDADDFHPQENLDKMQGGEALNDADRIPWLDKIGAAMIENTSSVFACSALKQKYRAQLASAVAPEKIIWVYLKGDKELIHQRMLSRNHFMPASLLDSQFEALEEPKQALYCDIAKLPEDIVSWLIQFLQ